jgi:hypothetical protein
MRDPGVRAARRVAVKARGSVSANQMRALDDLVRLVGLRRIVLLLPWLLRGAPSYSFLGLSTSFELMPLLLNALTFLLTPSVALWLSLFAPRFVVAWSPFSVVLLLAAIVADVSLLWHNWRIQMLLARGDASDAIARQVQRDFPAELRLFAQQALDTYRSRRSLRDTQSMHLALLDVARGDLAMLRLQVEIAIIDANEMQEWTPAQPWTSYL